jgi:transcriptional antiterminator
MLDNKKDHDKETYLDVDQVATKFAVSRRTIERIVERLQISRRKFRHDRKLYYSAESVARIGEELDKIAPNVERDSNI